MIRQVRTLAAACAVQWALHLASVAATGADALRSVSPEDILNIRWAAGLSLSPKGIQIAYLVIEPADGGDSKSRPLLNLWISATAKGSQPRTAALGHSDGHHPVRSPDGKCLAFLSKGNGSVQSNQVWLLRSADELPTCLTRTPKGVVEYCWPPDGTEIAFTTAERFDDEPDRKEIAVVAAPEDGKEAVFEKATLAVLDAKSGRDRRSRFSRRATDCRPGSTRCGRQKLWRLSHCVDHDADRPL